MKINNLFIFAFLTLFIYSIVLFFYYEKSQENAINQAELRTQDLLRNIKATKIFFNEDQKSKLKKLQKESNTQEKKFLPELYSCTYATKQINTYYNEFRINENMPTIDVSFISLNPKNIDNKAINEEIKLLNDFNKGILKTYQIVVETTKGKYLYFAKPVAKTKQSCLKCHGNPLNAPRAIIEKYGNTQGFYHKTGEIRAFIKILMPLDNYLKNTKKMFWTIALSFFIIIVLILILVKISFEKDKKQSKQLKRIMDTLDELIILKSDTKVYAVNKAFLKFYGVKNFKQFIKKHNCTSSTFIKGKNYINIDFRNPIDTLIKKLHSTEKSKRILQINNKNNEPRTFSVKIDKLEDNEDLHIIVLSDITKLQQRTEKFKKRANIDSLTEVYSRQKFNVLYESEFSRSIRYFNPLTILFLDIDYFKEVNDTYGHDIGDLTLKTFAKVIKNNIREYDVFARWGGEEFILMLPQTNINDGYKLAEKIRISILEHKFEMIETLTCSIGLSMLNKDDSSKKIIKRADTALYKAKKGGRNRTIIEI